MAYTTTPADNERIANLPGDIRAVTALVTTHTGAASAAHAASAISYGTGTVEAALNSAAGHQANQNNPHGVTAAQIGAVNTSDVVTTATANKILKLNSSGVLPASITGNAVTAGGLAVNATGVNNVANQIMRTNASGYAMCGYVNTTAPVTTTAASHYFVQTGSDGYIRPKALADVKAELGVDTAYDTGHSFTNNGYQKFSNGLIIQWGTTPSVTHNTNSTTDVILPITFPNAMLSATANSNLDSYPNGNWAIYTILLSASVLRLRTDESTNASNTFGINWIAIGY